MGTGVLHVMIIEEVIVEANALGERELMNLRTRLGNVVKRLGVQATGPLTLLLRQATPELPASLIPDVPVPRWVTRGRGFEPAQSRLLREELNVPSRTDRAAGAGSRAADAAVCRVVGHHCTTGVIDLGDGLSAGGLVERRPSHAGRRGDSSAWGEAGCAPDGRADEPTGLMGQDCECLG
jgi:hypothetical protein